MKEQQKCPETKLNKMKASNLLDNVQNASDKDAQRS